LSDIDSKAERSRIIHKHVAGYDLMRLATPSAKFDPSR
jgi:hypothetical protein